MSRNSTGYTGQLEPRRREFLSLVATLLPQETHDILLQTLNLFQLAIAICEEIIKNYGCIFCRNTGNEFGYAIIPCFRFN